MVPQHLNLLPDLRFDVASAGVERRQVALEGVDVIQGEIAPADALDHWWTLYDDAQLATLVEQALANSPDSRDAAAKLDQARAVRDAALDAYNPQGALTAAASQSKYRLTNPGAGSVAALSSLLSPSNFEPCFPSHLAVVRTTGRVTRAPDGATAS